MVLSRERSMLKPNYNVWNSFWCRIPHRLVMAEYHITPALGLMSFGYKLLVLHMTYISFKMSIKKEWFPLEGTQCANKRTSWAIIQAEKFFHKAEPSMWGFVFFELCHYSIVFHSYCLLIWSAEWQCFLKSPCWGKYSKAMRASAFSVSN